MISTGCASEPGKAGRGFLEPRPTPQQDMMLAVSTENPDERRAALTRVAGSRAYDADWAIEGFLTIATLEADSQARSVALRALARSRDPRAIDAVLRIVGAPGLTGDPLPPADALVRADALLVLAAFCDGGTIPPERLAAVRAVLLERLARDPDRQVRQVAARGLRCHPEVPVLEGLIAALRDRDFGVVYECESALVALTGRTHNCDAAAWQSWLGEHRAIAFAGAGQLPPERRPPYETGLGKLGYELRQLGDWLMPQEKPKGAASSR